MIADRKMGDRPWNIPPRASLNYLVGRSVNKHFSAAGPGCKVPSVEFDGRFEAI